EQVLAARHVVAGRRVAGALAREGAVHLVGKGRAPGEGAAEPVVLRAQSGARGDVGGARGAGRGGARRERSEQEQPQQERLHDESLPSGELEFQRERGYPSSMLAGVLLLALAVPGSCQIQAVEARGASAFPADYLHSISLSIAAQPFYASHLLNSFQAQ